MSDTVNRIFPFSYADLIRFCDNVHGFMVRDAVEMLTFGVTNVLTAAFKSKIDDFIDLPQDSAYEADEINATQEKNMIATQLRILVRAMNMRAKLAFGEKSGDYTRFQTKELSRLPDADLYLATEKVVEAATDLLAEMASVGLTQAMIDDLAAKNADFRAALIEQTAAIAARDKAVNNRVKMANELYELLTRYCDIGKTIWYETNEALYNDYVIYTGTSPGSLTAPDNFMFDPVNYDFSWSAVENATSYILQESTDGTNWSQYWSGHETTCAYEESPVVMMYFRVLAHNAGGNSAPSTVIQYDFAPDLIAPTNFNYDSGTFYFSWNAVPNAEYYEFQYRAQTNPTWNSLNAGSATSFYHADPPGGYLARVRGAVGTNFGPWSNELSYSVGPIQPD